MEAKDPFIAKISYLVTNGLNFVFFLKIEKIPSLVLSKILNFLQCSSYSLKELLFYKE